MDINSLISDTIIIIITKYNIKNNKDKKIKKDMIYMKLIKKINTWIRNLKNLININ